MGELHHDVGVTEHDLTEGQVRDVTPHAEGATHGVLDLTHVHVRTVVEDPANRSRNSVEPL